jgi:hypothetical protein
VSLDQTKEHLDFLTANLTRSPVEHLLLLRHALEASLFKLGHAPDEVKIVLDDFYRYCRTLH